MIISTPQNAFVEGTLSQLEVEISPEEHIVQGMDLVSPTSKDLKLVWVVKGTAGLSCDGQEGKLKQVFGQIVAENMGKELLFRQGWMQMVTWDEG
jgi:hypothetical protein